jgi:hypothetical protein
VPWYDGLAAADELALGERYPDRSLEQIGLLALERYGERLARFEPKVFRSPDELHMGFLHEGREFPFVSVPAPGQPAFRDLVVALTLRDTPAAQEVAIPNLARLPPLPPDVNLFAFSSIQKGARLFDRGASINRVADATVFTPHDASRLHWMLERRLFRYEEGRLLPPDWRVGRRGKRYALRFLDEAAWKWVDPAGTGRTPG